MKELDCPLDDATLIETVIAMNAELARTGAKSWRMHIPVDLSRDSDILIAEIARRLRTTLKDRDELLAALKAFGPALAGRVFDLEDPMLAVAESARVLIARIESAKEPS